ncbi:MAG TPA: hypothetical protein VFB78_15630 [Acidimicrobiales bacterium]|nr:hypothetical protein [Acidimicrobiales bacterium]
MRRLAVILGTAALLLAGCRSDTVRISFQPKQGARYEYEVNVRAVTRSTLADAAPRRSPVDDFVVHAIHRVVSVGPDDTELEVRLEIPGIGQRTFTARFDRGAQLSRIQSIEGVPAAALGQLGLSEILPGAAAGAPPQRGLSPGDRWSINLPADLLGGAGSRVRGEGRLVELGVIRGRDVATVESRFSLPVKRTTTAGDATIELDGTQTTTMRTVRTLTDGAVESANAVTEARYKVTLMPPPGSAGAPVTGRLTVEVRSTTRRVR